MANDNILEALGKLDPDNTNHWTVDGQPRLDTLKMLSGDQTLTREVVVAAAGNYSRADAQAGKAPQAPEGATPAATPAATQETPQGDTKAAATPDNGEPAPPAPEQPAPVVTPEDKPFDELQAALKEQEAKVAELRKMKAEIDTAFDQARIEEDALRQRVEAAQLEQGDDNQSAIRAYLKRQRENLQQRAANQKALLESGVSLKDLAKAVGKAPIDQAMARKNNRGTQRPGG